MFQNESDIIAAEVAAWKSLAKHAGHFVLVRVIGVVQGAIDTRAFALISGFEYVARDGVRHIHIRRFLFVGVRIRENGQRL
jgi:hypothetical protein